MYGEFDKPIENERNNRNIPVIVCEHCRAVIAVCIEICAEDMAAVVELGIRAYEAAGGGVVVAGVEIVEPRFGVVHIPAIAQRIYTAYTASITNNKINGEI